MRLLEQTLVEVRLAPRVVRRDQLGGTAEAFSAQTVKLRAGRLPAGGEAEMRPQGAAYPRRMRLLVPGDTDAAAGDGIWMEESLWRILSVERWTAHVELICEAIQ